MEEKKRNPVEILESFNLEEQLEILQEIDKISQEGLVGRKIEAAAKRIETEVQLGQGYDVWFNTIEMKIPLIIALKFAPKIALQDTNPKKRGDEKVTHSYKTSTDYEKLFELVHAQRVVCFVPYDKDSKTKDICQSQTMCIDRSIDIGARGISYISALAINGKTLKDDFIMQCQVFGLEYIEPNNLECSWKFNESDGNFNGSCGIKWELSNDGTLKDNHMNFCPQCGKKVVEVKAKQIEAIGYYMLVSNLWQKTTKEAYDMCTMLKKVRINMEYFDESWELLHSDINTDEAIKEVEEYLKEL